jgi:hypothetical protein
MKICSRCKIIKNITDFYFRKDNSNYRNECKECYSLFLKNYYISNKDKIKNRSNKYYFNNKEKVKIYQKNNKEIINKWANGNKRKQYIKTKLQTDIEFKIKKLISSSINFQLNKNNSSKKRKSCLDYLPYSIKELKQHIENLFYHSNNLHNGKVWMTWNNRGLYIVKTWNDNDTSTWTWQLDHIIPHSTFKYISMEDQSFKDCWALSNLQPLSAKQNWIDGIYRIRHKTKK